LDDASATPVPPDVRVVADPALAAGAPPLDAALAARVDALFEAERARRGGALWNGALLAFVAREGSLVRGRFVEYKRFLAQRLDPSLAAALDVVPLAVGGLLRRAGAVAFGRRPGDVTQYPGFLELAPSGGLGRSSALRDGTIDFRRQLLDELEEETGISRAAVLRVEPFALVRDQGVLDLVAEIDLFPDAEAAAARAADRYRALEWIGEADLPAFAARRRAEIVPGSLAALRVRGLLPGG